MTKTLTTEQLQDIYEAAVREEATGNPDESGEEAFDLLYLLDSTGGTGATIRKLIDLVRAANREAQPVGEEEINAALRLHRLKVEGHSQLSDAFRAGFKYARRTAPPAPAVPDGVMPGGLVYSSALPKFESNDSDKIVGYRCFISGDTRIVESQEQAYADAKAVINACRAAMLAQPVSQGCELPDNVREALTLALQAMEFMGDTLNNIDAVCTEDVEYVTPAFAAVRGLLAAAPEGGNEK